MPQLIVGADGRHAVGEGVQKEAVDGRRSAVIKRVGVRADGRRDVQKEHQAVRARPVQGLEATHRTQPRCEAAVALQAVNHRGVRLLPTNADHGLHLIVREPVHRRELLLVETVHRTHVRQQFVFDGQVFDAFVILVGPGQLPRQREVHTAVQLNRVQVPPQERLEIGDGALNAT